MPHVCWLGLQLQFLLPTEKLPTCIHLYYLLYYWSIRVIIAWIITVCCLHGPYATPTSKPRQAVNKISVKRHKMKRVLCKLLLLLAIKEKRANWSSGGSWAVDRATNILTASYLVHLKKSLCILHRSYTRALTKTLLLQHVFKLSFDDFCLPQYVNAKPNCIV